MLDVSNVADVSHVAVNTVSAVGQDETLLRHGTLYIDDGAIPTVRIINLRSWWGGFPNGGQYRFIPPGGVAYGDWNDIGTSSQTDGVLTLVVGRRYQFRDGDSGTVFPETGHVAAAANSSGLLQSVALVTTNPPSVSPSTFVETGTLVTFTAPETEGYATGAITRQWQYFRNGRWDSIPNQTGETYQYEARVNYTERVRVLTGRQGFEAMSPEISVQWLVGPTAGVLTIAGLPTSPIAEQEILRLVASSSGGNYDTVDYAWSLTSATPNLIGGLSSQTGQQVNYEAANLSPTDYVGVEVNLTATYRGNNANAFAGATPATVTITSPRIVIYGVDRDTYTRWARAQTQPNPPSPTTRDASSPWTLYQDPGTVVGDNVYRLDGEREYRASHLGRREFYRAVWSVTKVHDALLPNASAGTPTLTPGTTVDSGQTVQFGVTHAGGTYDTVQLLGWSVNAQGALGSGRIGADGSYTAPLITDPTVQHPVNLTVEVLYKGTGTNARAGTEARVYLNPVLTIQGVALTDRIINLYARSFYPPPIPASNVELPDFPWMLNRPDATSRDNVWLLRWDRVYTESVFISASGTLGLSHFRTEGAHYVTALNAGEYAHSEATRRWDKADNARPLLPSNLRASSTTVYLREVRLWTTSPQLIIDFAPAQTSDARADLSELWEAGGYVILVVGNLWFGFRTGDAGVTTVQAYDPYNWEFSGDKLAEFTAFRNALPSSGTDGVAGELLLDDGAGLIVDVAAYLGLGTSTPQELTSLFFGNGSNIPVEATHVVLGDDTSTGIRII